MKFNTYCTYMSTNHHIRLNINVSCYLPYVSQFSPCVNISISLYQPFCNNTHYVFTLSLGTSLFQRNNYFYVLKVWNVFVNKVFLCLIGTHPQIVSKRKNNKYCWMYMYSLLYNIIMIHIH